MAATGKVIGTVTAVVGEAKATAADGTVRILQVGDSVHSDEVITTSEAGSINVALEGGKTLDCSGGVDLALHESLLTVANASSPASDIESLQRAIAAGQDPSQVAAATAAGGAPAAGGSDLDGGAHEPVILEQGNSASIVTSGFSTEGETLDFTTPQTQSLQPVVLAAAVATPSGSNEHANAPAPIQAAFETPAQLTLPVEEHVAAPANVPAPAQPELPAVVAETPAVQTVENNAAPEVVVPEQVAQNSQPPVVDAPSNPAPVVPAAETPAVQTVENNGAPEVVVSEQVAQNSQPPVVDAPSTPDPVVPAAETPNPDPVVASNDTPQSDDTPIVVINDTPQSDDTPIVVIADTPHSDDTPIVATEDTPPSEDAPVIVADDTPPSDETPVVVVTAEPSDEVVPPTSDNSGSFTASISANSNQDEQLALLTLHKEGGEDFQALVFFGQEGQQKPTAVPINFELADGKVTLQYIDSFAGNSDSGTGHTSQKIAIKDFALSNSGEEVQLADQNDGVNIGLGSKSLKTEASVQLGANGQVDGDWSFQNADGSANDRVTYDANQQQDGGEGFDILDVKGSLDLTNVNSLSNFEVISLKGDDAQDLTLEASDVLKVSGGEALHIIGGKEDTLNLAGGGWTDSEGHALSGTGSYSASYFGWVEVKNGATTLLVDPDVNIHVMG